MSDITEARKESTRLKRAELRQRLDRGEVVRCEVCGREFHGMRSITFDYDDTGAVVRIRHKIYMNPHTGGTSTVGCSSPEKHAEARVADIRLELAEAEAHLARVLARKGW